MSGNTARLSASRNQAHSCNPHTVDGSKNALASSVFLKKEELQVPGDKLGPAGVAENLVGRPSEIQELSVLAVRYEFWVRAPA